jgi:hypothetical protein
LDPVTPENDEVWITLKDVGKVQVFSAKPPFDQKVVHAARRGNALAIQYPVL